MNQLQASRLKSKVDYFLSAGDRRGRQSALEAIKEFQELGDLAIVGGMLRDLTLVGNLAFASDVDLVIKAEDPDNFHHVAHKLNGKRNRFGGYSFNTGKWSVEVWSLSETWAHVHKHKTIERFDDLQEATFFDCDAIIYDIKNKKLLASNDYFQRLTDRVININLEENPNVLGNIVRAFKYAFKKEMRWERKLTKFVSDRLADIRWEELVKYESCSFMTNQIRTLKEADFCRSIEGYLASNDAKFFDPFPKLRQQQQYEFDL